MKSPLLEVTDLKKHFLVHSGPLGAGAATVYAVDGVSFAIDRSETLALVGESGCGKSTVGRCILRLFDITSGQVVLDGKRIDDLSAGALRPFRRRIQVVFQDPFSSLNPRMRVRDILAEPIRNFHLAKSRADLAARVDRLLDVVRLSREASLDWDDLARLAVDPLVTIGSGTVNYPILSNLKDAAALTEVVLDAARLGLDIGALDVLQKYDRWRRFDSFALSVATDGLNRLFSNDIAPIRALRDLGMGIVDPT